MNKKIVFGIIGILAIIASVVMYRIGKNSSHLSELKDFWWYPLPLAAICFLVAGAKKKEG
ncbi:MAG: hypothetical protein WAT34_06180 [Chitinophagaceae bacterium]